GDGHERHLRFGGVGAGGGRSRRQATRPYRAEARAPVAALSRSASGGEKCLQSPGGGVSSKRGSGTCPVQPPRRTARGRAMCAPECDTRQIRIQFGVGLRRHVARDIWRDITECWYRDQSQRTVAIQLGFRDPASVSRGVNYGELTLESLIVILTRA